MTEAASVSETGLAVRDAVLSTLAYAVIVGVCGALGFGAAMLANAAGLSDHLQVAIAVLVPAVLALPMGLWIGLRVGARP